MGPIIFFFSSRKVPWVQVVLGVGHFFGLVNLLGPGNVLGWKLFGSRLPHWLTYLTGQTESNCTQKLCQAALRSAQERTASYFFVNSFLR